MQNDSTHTQSCRESWPCCTPNVATLSAGGTLFAGFGLATYLEIGIPLISGKSVSMATIGVLGGLTGASLICFAVGIGMSIHKACTTAPEQRLLPAYRTNLQ